MAATISDSTSIFCEVRQKIFCEVRCKKNILRGKKKKIFWEVLCPQQDKGTCISTNLPTGPEVQGKYSADLFVQRAQTIFKVMIMEIVVMIMMRVTRLSCQKLLKVMTMIVGIAMMMFKDLFVKYSQKIFKAQQRARESGSSAEEKKPWFTYLSFQSVHDPLQVHFPF